MESTFLDISISAFLKSYEAYPGVVRPLVTGDVPVKSANISLYNSFP
jgi:hypothetical protein